MKKYCVFSAIFYFCYAVTPFAYAFDSDYMHLSINENSAVQSRLSAFSQNHLGFSDGIRNVFNGKTALVWIQEGGKAEDAGIRWFNHFHDPLQPIEHAGFKDLSATQSSLAWAQSNEKNDASWPVARQLFYEALTTGSEERYANLFLAVGQLTHLVSDKAVPPHVRDDAHPETKLSEWGFKITHFEVWAKEHYADASMNYNGIKPDTAIFSNYQATDLAPSAIARLWDTDLYNGSNPEVTLTSNTGLAEFTNANFFSEGTVFSSKYPHPNYDDLVRTKTQIPDPFNSTKTVSRAYWMKQAVGDLPSYRASGDGYNTYYLEELYTDGWKDFETFPPLDKYVFQDYSGILVPRAVGYSAALIDYFFRGRIEIAEPKVSVGADCSITGISLSMKNATPPLDNSMQVEPYVNGTIDLVYSYLPPDSEERVYHLYPAIYSIEDSTDNINSEFVPVQISALDPQPPPGAKDFSILLVFSGTLGNEAGAVAAQVHNFSSSSIAYYYQPDGRPNESNIYTVSPERFDPAQITSATSGNPWYFAPAWSYDARMLAFEKETCTDPNFTPGETCSSPYYVREILIADPLSTQNFPDNLLHTLNYGTADAALPAFSPDSTTVVTLLLRENRWYWGELALYDLNTGTFSTINTGDDPDLVDFAGSRPAWSPDGESIVYYLGWQYNPTIGQMEFQGDLVRIRPDGTGKTRLTDDEFINTQPDWSPDGSLIAFASDRDGENSMDIWVMDKDGNNRKRIVNCTPASCYSPTFSPDGQHIAFSQGSIIYVSDMAGNVIPIGTPGLLTGSLDWSPELCRP